MYDYRKHNQSIHLMLSYPIKVTLHERSINLPYVINLLEQKGFKYSYNGVKSSINGYNSSNINFNYFTNIYSVLGLPVMTIELLNEYYQRWLDIQSFKLERRNANRIKKGLQPVNSISTRIK